jgi:alanyl-tRNA synthetase
MMLFGEKYGDVVRMIEFGESRELCGGIHVEETAQIELFKVKSEGSVASGIRRIEALTSNGAGLFLKNKIEVLSGCDLNGVLTNEFIEIVDKAKNSLIEQYNRVGDLSEVEIKLMEGGWPIERINQLISDLTKIKFDKRVVDALTAKKKELSKAGKQDNAAQTKVVKEELLANVQVIDGVNVIAQKIELDDSAAIKDLAFQIKAQVNNLFLILGAEVNGKPSLTIIVSEELSKAKDLHAGNIVREAAKEMRGGGGGQPFFATAGGSYIEGIESAIEKAKSFLK